MSLQLKNIRKLGSGNAISSLYYFLSYYIPILIQRYIPGLKSDVCNPGLDFLLLFFFFIGGIIWLVVSLLLVVREQNPFYIGALFINILVFIGIAIWYFKDSKPNQPNSSNQPDHFEFESMEIINRNDTSWVIADKVDTLMVNVKGKAVE